MVDEGWQKQVGRLWFDAKSLEKRLTQIVGGEITPELRLAAMLLQAHAQQIPVLEGGVVVHVAGTAPIQLVRRAEQEGKWKQQALQQEAKRQAWLKRTTPGDDHECKTTDGPADPTHCTCESGSACLQSV